MLLDEVIACITDVDIIFTEGYKRESKRKIEVFRAAVCDSPLCSKEELFAVASDTVLHDDIPHFSLDDAKEMADFLEQSLLRIK